MDNNRIVIVTTTFYNDTTDSRYKSAINMATQCNENNVPLCIVDDSPSPSIKDSFRSLGAYVYKQTNKGMG